MNRVLFGGFDSCAEKIQAYKNKLETQMSTNNINDDKKHKTHAKPAMKFVPVTVTVLPA